MAPRKKALPELVADGRRWRRVDAPRPWKPTAPGESLTGTFLGWQTRRGRDDGSYEIALIMTEEDGEKKTHYVSGTVLQTLFQVSGIAPGDKRVVRVVFWDAGTGTSHGGRDRPWSGGS